MAEKRPNPEQLLHRVQEEERQQQRGKLKIYLGAAPGVGKTFTMLQDAIAQRAEGLDVVVGIVETHGRQEIAEMLQRLEILPRKTFDYRGKQLPEFDLPAALKRHPGLILIDEMAHTNAPGARYPKRWQDIEEILNNGIDVHTTLNVQHIESLNDVVAQIIGIPIKETVPDSALELADTIELVDLPPEELLIRLQEGKVYIPEQASLAKEHFFRKGNLIALRDLALRVTAECVETQVLLYRQGEGIQRIWPTKERLLVCVGPGTKSAKVIRAAKRMATGLQAEWLAVHVEAPRLHLSQAEHNQVIQNLRLAAVLGAETRILHGRDLVKEIINFAHEWNVTKIIIGKQIRPRWKDFLFRSLADELIRHSKEIDIYIITGDRIEMKPPTPVPVKRRIPWKIYGISAGIIALATVIDCLLYSYVGLSNLIMVYLLGVIGVALLGRLGPSLLASVLSVLAYDFFFVPPRFSFMVASIQYFITLIVMFLVTQIISYLTILLRRQIESMRRTERRTATLHTLSRQLASTRGINKLLDIIVRFISDVFDSEVMVLLPEEGQLAVYARYKTDSILDDKEQSVAQWVYELGEMAGLGTDILPFSDAIYVPLLASQGPVGVLRVRPFQEDHLLTLEQIHLLEACAYQIGSALEVEGVQE
jgi:two-component system sensor histidine kinase KdpD